MDFSRPMFKLIVHMPGNLSDIMYYNSIDVSIFFLQYLNSLQKFLKQDIFKIDNNEGNNIPVRYFGETIDPTTGRGGLRDDFVVIVVVL